MTTIKYHKLVRDRIPQIIGASGKKVSAPYKHVVHIPC